MIKKISVAKTTEISPASSCFQDNSLNRLVRKLRFANRFDKSNLLQFSGHSHAKSREMKFQTEKDLKQNQNIIWENLYVRKKPLSMRLRTCICRLLRRNHQGNNKSANSRTFDESALFRIREAGD